MGETVGIPDLLPGDVLLYRGTGFVSRGIQFFDGSELSHAAVYMGDGVVGEAIATGLERQDIQASVKGCEWVKAYRLKDRPADVSPVLGKANAYLDDGPRYGYEQLLLLAFLCTTRKLKITPSLHVLIRRVLDAAANILTRMVSQGKEPMICSEFVYRAYDEALPEIDDPYSLRINEMVRAVLGAMPGVATRSGVPLSIPRGQGVHPESLLAFLSSESSGAWLGGPAGPRPRAAPVPQPVDEAEIEELIAGYLDEVRQEAPAARARRAAPPGAGVEELYVATERFATSLYAATHDEEATAAAARSARAARSPVNAYLFQTAADFVTPADLYRTQSLFLVGLLEV
jgi:hypothetical protein